MDSQQLRARFAQAAAAATRASKQAAAHLEDAARKAAPHIEVAAAKAAAHIEDAAAKAKPHLEAAAKEVQKRIDRDAAKRLLGGVLKDWLDGDIPCGNYGPSGSVLARITHRFPHRRHRLD